MADPSARSPSKYTNTQAVQSLSTQEAIKQSAPLITHTFSQIKSLKPLDFSSLFIRKMSDHKEKSIYDFDKFQSSENYAIWSIGTKQPLSRDDTYVGCHHRTTHTARKLQGRSRSTRIVRE
jgi:hypothetical protein